MIRPQRLAGSLLAASCIVGLSTAACGGDEIVSDREKCLKQVPQDSAVLRAVVEPVIETRFRDSMYYGHDCDSGERAFLEWEVTGAAKDVVETLRAAGWTTSSSEGLDPMVADVHLQREVEGHRVELFIACMDNGECDAAAGLD